MIARHLPKPIGTKPLASAETRRTISSPSSRKLRFAPFASRPGSLLPVVSSSRLPKPSRFGPIHASSDTKRPYRVTWCQIAGAATNGGFSGSLPESRHSATGPM